MSSEGWVVFGSVGGALVGALGGFAGAVISTRAAERRHRQRLAVEAGMREWEQVNRSAQDLAKAHPGKNFPVAPLFSFVLLNVRILDLVERGDLSPEALRQFMKERDQLTNEVFADDARKRSR